MCLIFSFDFWKDRSFREKTDMNVIDIDKVSVPGYVYVYMYIRIYMYQYGIY